FILAAEGEMVRDSMRILRDRMKANMGEEKVKYVETYGASHNVLMMNLFEPYRTEALKEIGHWAETL
ncbi:hypothetical protein C8J56DRAFT_803894, partial [Mycena floridula]